MENVWTGKKVKISVANNLYYKGEVLSEGEDWIRIRDIHSNIVFIKMSAINVIEELGQ